MTTNLTPLFENVSAIARVVGATVRNWIFDQKRSMDIGFKAATDLVTEVDLWSEKTIQDYVSVHYPSHLLVGEETSTKLSAERDRSLEQLVNEHMCWIVDPIDGTTNFANHIPHCAISIAVYDHGTPLVGVIYDPSRDELFGSVKGKGATLNGQPIHCSCKNLMKDALVATGLPTDCRREWNRYRHAFEAFLHQSRNVRVLGSAALDAAWVACGRLDGFFEYSLKPWDVAAGALLVQEAGGRIGNFELASPESFSLFRKSFLFSNSQLYSDMFAIASRAHGAAL